MNFSTRFECDFHFLLFDTENLFFLEGLQVTSAVDLKNTLETSGEDRKLHSKRVEKIENYTRNEQRRCKPTLETSGEDVKVHSKIRTSGPCFQQ
jgi:hypothetical protein